MTYLYYIGILAQNNEEDNGYIFSTNITPTPRTYPQYSRVYGPFESGQDAKSCYESSKPLVENTDTCISEK